MKTAIITGASSGLGELFALKLEKYFPEIEAVWLIARRRERMESIAQKLNYSPAYVSTIFSTYAGRNFKAYLDNIRVNRAADLLKKTGLNISEIAMQCGFSTLRTFNNTFRRIIGTTPTAYRSEDTQSN